MSDYLQTHRNKGLS